jgi:predicted GNAT superfamily acetyltransferase
MLPHTRDLSSPPDGATAFADSADRSTTGVSFRRLSSLEDFQACVALQKEVWGDAFTDSVPASILQVASHIGGVIIGAFDEDVLIGFVFGLTGVRDGEPVHWSHMLGVRATAREHGIGRQLKELQRAELARRGIAREFWTFDPLQARNAHLNVNRLGVRVMDYAVNMYGSTDSPLHLGMATDRLIVELDTAASPRVIPDGVVAPSVRLPVLSPAPRPGDPEVDGERPQHALIEIPWDLQTGALTPDALLRWRLATREHFQWSFLHGYRVTALHRDRAASRAFYLIERGRD